MNNRSFNVRFWDLAYTPRVALDVRDLITLSLDVRQDNGSANTWTSAINVKWGNTPDEGTPHDFGTPASMSTTTPYIRNIDVTDIAYVILERATNVTAQQLVEVWGTGKSDTGIGRAV